MFRPRKKDIESFPIFHETRPLSTSEIDNNNIELVALPTVDFVIVDSFGEFGKLFGPFCKA
jgi:hypothetical protein